jgi:hypothetical protein
VPNGFPEWNRELMPQHRHSAIDIHQSAIPIDLPRPLLPSGPRYSPLINLPADAKIDVAGVNTLAVGQTIAGVIAASTLNASTFDVTDNSALFDFQAILNGSQIDLNVLQVSVTHSGVLDAVLANGPASAIGAARVFDNLINGTGTGIGTPSGDMGTVISALGSFSSQRDVARAAAQTLPLNGGVTQSMLGMLESFNSVVQDHLAGAGGDNGGGNLVAAPVISVEFLPVKTLPVIMPGPRPSARTRIRTIAAARPVSAQIAGAPRSVWTRR